MKLFRFWLAVCVVCGLAAALPLPALARGHLDPSFGDGGIVNLATRSENDPFATLERARVGPDGEVFLLEEGTSCDGITCSTHLYLRRYFPEGSPVSVLGGSRVTVGATKRDYTNGDGAGALAVDSAKRSVVAVASEGTITVRRFATDGNPDTSFGSGGATTVRCECQLDSVEAGPGNELLLLGHSNIEHIEALRGTNWFVARLDENGSLDPGFGSGGIVRRTMSRFNSPEAVPSPDGGALLYGFTCCSARTEPFVQAWTAGGHSQRRYSGLAERTLAGLRDNRWGELDWTQLAVIPRGRGRVDLVGEANDHGEAVRLRRDGRKDFARGTRNRRPPWGRGFHFLDAAGDGLGGTFVLGTTGRNGRFHEVIRLRPDGRLDRRFGVVELPGVYGEGELEIHSQGRGGALVFSDGRTSCRQYCPPRPKLFRVVGIRR